MLFSNVLLAWQEAVILGVDRKVHFPLHISCHFLVYTPLPSTQRSSQGHYVDQSESTNCDGHQDNSNPSNAAGIEGNG